MKWTNNKKLFWQNTAYVINIKRYAKSLLKCVSISGNKHDRKFTYLQEMKILNQSNLKRRKRASIDLSIQYKFLPQFHKDSVNRNMNVLATG